MLPCETLTSDRDRPASGASGNDKGAGASIAAQGADSGQQPQAVACTFRVGDTVLVDFLRGKTWEEAPLAIYALFEVRSAAAGLVAAPPSCPVLCSWA